MPSVAPKVALVTCAHIPEPDPDEAMQLEACRDAGFETELVGWDDPKVDWSRYDAAVLRSAWNYHEHEAAFRRWIADTSAVTDLWNPPALMLDTIHKSYLAGRRDKGIPIVPTVFADARSPKALEDLLADQPWQEFVVKPAVSAASFKTKRFHRDEMPAAEEFLADILNDRDAMVQPLLSKVAHGGEICIVFVDGDLTHGVVKYPRFADDVESVSEVAVLPNAEQRALAERVMATVAQPWLYGRVDLMLTDDDQWVLSELELIEPSLFFLQHPPALARFVEGLKRRCG